MQIGKEKVKIGRLHLQIQFYLHIENPKEPIDRTVSLARF